jgi:hypothetical protein
MFRWKHVLERERRDATGHPIRDELSSLNNFVPIRFIEAAGG